MERGVRELEVVETLVSINVREGRSRGNSVHGKGRGLGTVEVLEMLRFDVGSHWNTEEDENEMTDNK